ncbi:uncharacterized protein LOC117102518 [Anneissia japonica]|uniref:uncharacterized protein LOC117102518 n=1 Tax=Anneissia japonica TaxID=1529436 RepID=UPI001425A65E|nr:uncharacterized protein LOC117102518 [Anneissia japonica]
MNLNNVYTHLNMDLLFAVHLSTQFLKVFLYPRVTIRLSLFVTLAIATGSREVNELRCHVLRNGEECPMNYERSKKMCCTNLKDHTDQVWNNFGIKQQVNICKAGVDIAILSNHNKHSIFHVASNNTGESE